MSENTPLVSVIMPTYNRARQIGAALQSIIGQSYPNVEVLVVDDGSADNTGDVVKQFKTVRYIQQLHAGQSAARNRGLMSATGSIIACLDSDDIWYPDFLQKCVQKMVEGDYDLVFANWDQKEKNGTSRDFLSKHLHIVPFFDQIKDGWGTIEGKDLRKVFLLGCPSPSSSVIMKRSSIVGGWRSDIKIGDDWYVQLEMVLSKPCRASFTLDRLWQKNVDDTNIYDGRKHSEVLEQLFIGDYEKIIERFRDQLQTEELLILQEKYIYSLVELAKHNVLRERNITKASKLISKSLGINVHRTLTSIPKVISTGFERKYGKLKPPGQSESEISVEEKSGK